MKKLLLLSLLSVGFASNAQVYWEENVTGFSSPSTGINEIRYVDANNVWVTGYDGSGGAATFRVFAKSADGGETWTNGPINLGSTVLGIGGICPLSATVAYVAAFPDATTVQGGVWKTVDGGTVWTKQPTALYNTGTDSFTNMVYFWDANVGVTAGDPASGYFEIYTTVNGGTNWSRVPSTNIPTPLTGEYGYTRIFETYGNTIWLGTNKGRLLRSSDKGLTWSIFQTPNTDFGDADLGASFSFQDDLHGIMIFKDWQQFSTADGGATWTAEFPDGVIRNGDVTFVGGMPGVLINIGEDLIDSARGASYSTDNGASWVDFGEPIDAVSAVEFFDATHGLVSAFNSSTTEGGIYHWINDVNTLATVNFQETKAITASPNPTTGVLNIAGKNISHVAVYDILGKEVSNTNYSALNNVALNLSSLNAGVYMVKVSNNTGSASTIKVVKQ
jgi:photosystem II stability/assembly factor-like uncharacterized protein